MIGLQCCIVAGINRRMADCHKAVKQAGVGSREAGKTFLSYKTLTGPVFQEMKRKKL